MPMFAMKLSNLILGVFLVILSLSLTYVNSQDTIEKIYSDLRDGLRPSDSVLECLGLPKPPTSSKDTKIDPKLTKYKQVSDKRKGKKGDFKSQANKLNEAINDFKKSKTDGTKKNAMKSETRKARNTMDKGMKELLTELKATYDANKDDFKGTKDKLITDGCKNLGECVSNMNAKWKKLRDEAAKTEDKAKKDQYLADAKAEKEKLKSCATQLKELKKNAKENAKNKVKALGAVMGKRKGQKLTSAEKQEASTILGLGVTLMGTDGTGTAFLEGYSKVYRKVGGFFNKYSPKESASLIQIKEDPEAAELLKNANDAKAGGTSGLDLQWSGYEYGADIAATLWGFSAGTEGNIECLMDWRNYEAKCFAGHINMYGIDPSHLVRLPPHTYASIGLGGSMTFKIGFAKQQSDDSYLPLKSLVQDPCAAGFTGDASVSLPIEGFDFADGSIGIDFVFGGSPTNKFKTFYGGDWCVPFPRSHNSYSMEVGLSLGLGVSLSADDQSPVELMIQLTSQTTIVELFKVDCDTGIAPLSIGCMFGLATATAAPFLSTPLGPPILIANAFFSVYFAADALIQWFEDVGEAIVDTFELVGKVLSKVPEVVKKVGCFYGKVLDIPSNWIPTYINCADRKKITLEDGSEIWLTEEHEIRVWKNNKWGFLQAGQLKKNDIVEKNEKKMGIKSISDDEGRIVNIWTKEETFKLDGVTIRKHNEYPVHKWEKQMTKEKVELQAGHFHIEKLIKDYSGNIQNAIEDFNFFKRNLVKFQLRCFNGLLDENKIKDDIKKGETSKKPFFKSVWNKVFGKKK